MTIPVPELRLDRPFYNATELAVACGVGRSTVHRHLADGYLAYDGFIAGRQAFTRSAALDYNKRVWTQRAERGNS